MSPSARRRASIDIIDRFDFVVGNIDVGTERPCIAKPELVAEVKSFPFGFTRHQHREHYLNAIEDDLPKLASPRDPLDSRYEILFDEARALLK